MIEMDEQEFKQISYEFHQRASRLCRAKFQEVKMQLSKFLAYIERTPIIHDYIQECVPNMSDDELKEMTETVIQARGQIAFDFGNGRSEETARLFRILKYADEPDDFGRILAIGHAFEYSSQLQASVESFIHVLVSPFVDNIEYFLRSIAMKVRAAPEKHLTLNISGDHAQVNVSQDQSSLHATQNNGIASWEAIEEELRQYRVSREDIAELKAILLQERPEGKDKLGAKINGWIANIIQKAALGLVNIPMATASGILTALICRYYGWS